MFKNSTLNDNKKEIGVTKNGQNFLAPRVHSPVVQSPDVQSPSVQSSRVKASGHPVFKLPGVQSPRVQAFRRPDAKRPDHASRVQSPTFLVCQFIHLISKEGENKCYVKYVF